MPLLADLLGADADEGIVLKGIEGIEGLIGEDVPIGQEEDAGTTLAVALQVPAAVEELPGDLKGNGRLPGPRSEGEEDALLPLGHRVQDAGDGVLLIIAHLPGPALVLEGDVEQGLPPFFDLLLLLAARQGKAPLPDRFRGREGIDLPFLPALHVDLVDPLPVGGIGEADLQVLGVLLGLRHPFVVGLLLGFGLDHRQVPVLVLEDVIGQERTPPPPLPEELPGRDPVLLPDDALLRLAPSCIPKGRFDELVCGVGFVQAAISSWTSSLSSP